MNEHNSSMVRQRTPTSKLHRHCESCHSRRCRTPIEISVSCLLINCRLLCGAVFHLCKEEEHKLLCPNEKVPCLNAHYGCPFTLCRSQLAKHLEVCPASVVCCSMDWNRWPIEEEDNAEFYQNILRETYQEEPLDLAMALRDQRHLFQSLKMKALFPELIEKVKEADPPVLAKEEGAVGGDLLADEQAGASASADTTSNPELQEVGLTQEEREALARNPHVGDLDSYSAWERMFSMELSGCKHTIKALGTKPEPSTSRERRLPISPYKLETVEERPEQPGKETPAPAANIPDFCPYGMDEEKFIIASALFACDKNPKKKFIYKSVEPMKIKTVRTFRFPASYRAKSTRIRNPSRNKRISKEVDTADLGFQLEDLPKWDEVQATILCSLEKELRGHLIAEASVTDGLLVDEGTQTYDFHSAPFKQDTSLADLTADRPLKLHVQVQTESVTRRHNKSSSVFTYLCCQSFRRDEFASHFKNVHSDIHTCVSGWFEQRCPLSYLGCTYTQKRFQPSTHRATVTYDKELSTFCLRPDVPPILQESMKPVTSERKRARNLDPLSTLPFEVLVHIAGFLDSFTLSQLALVSKFMREVCAVLLHERGMVTLKWEKKTYSHGGFCWRSRKQVWQFSNLFSTVRCWRFDEFPPISEHLKVCPYYNTERKTDPFPLTGVFQSQDTDVKSQSLVSMFLKN
ncbi:F-box protein 40.1 [Chanos chanos]|uniref:F-box protein 40.1 n=1 Tax=Chanos chanos TaxID=29144 RepID=A0A6J2VU80_CHACN|nr:F-box only protein 40-like [Chanos chanos]